MENTEKGNHGEHREMKARRTQRNKTKENTEKGNHREHREMKPRRTQRRILTDITK
jgi:hypothetical protein